MQDRHEFLIRLEHLYARIRNNKIPQKADVCELVDLFEVLAFDVYGELERLASSKCGFLRKAMCVREEDSRFNANIKAFPANPRTGLAVNQQGIN
jgi:hypothetical protein